MTTPLTDRLLATLAERTAERDTARAEVEALRAKLAKNDVYESLKRAARAAGANGTDWDEFLGTYRRQKQMASLTEGQRFDVSNAWRSGMGRKR